MKEKGTVKWFNGAKGYGFIQRSTGEDVFVHFSAIQENGYRTLNEGETVEYELMKGPKGFLAANVLRGSAQLAKGKPSINVSPVAGKGIFYCTLGVLLSAAAQKNEAGRFNIVQPQIQARPCLIVLAARPGNLPERSVSFSGTEVLQLPDDSWREWLRETSFQGLLLFWGPAKQDFSKLGVIKIVDCRRIRLQIDCG